MTRLAAVFASVIFVACGAAVPAANPAPTLAPAPSAAVIAVHDGELTLEVSELI